MARGLFVPMDFLDDEVSDAESNASLHQFTINEHYAKAFAYKKEREELSKCAVFSCATQFSSLLKLVCATSERKVWFRLRPRRRR